MNDQEQLLSKRWILKDEDRDTYYHIKDNMKYLKKLFMDHLGYALISHQNFIKLDKIPGKAEPWMGITDFKSLEEYRMFCYVLIFLEDRDPEDQFILSHLTAFIAVQLGERESYWLKYTARKRLVNVIKLCLKEKLILLDDGDSDNFASNEQAEALFENTGLSRYFMRHFVSDIFSLHDPQDFMQAEWVGLDEDRGIVRKQRIYRRLLLSCGIYQEDEEQDDFSFIRNYRKRMQNDFNEIFPCELQVYASSAYLILDEEARLGKRFPKNNARDELLVLVNSELTRQNKRYLSDPKREILTLTTDQALHVIEGVIRQNHAYLPVVYRQKKIDQLAREVLNTYLLLGFAKEMDELISFYPVIGKLNGSYEEGDQ